MKKFTLLSFITLFSLSLSGQIHWLRVQNSENGKTALYDLVSTEKVMESENVRLLNFNPSLSLSKTVELQIQHEALNQCNIFTIYNPSTSTSEELIWQICNKDKDQLLLTNDRIADLAQGKFINFPKRDPLKPQINSYHHHQQKFNADKIILGGRPSNASIPVQEYSGALAELIVFDRKLAPAAQQVLESHLALKYSIPLHHGLDYLDAKARPIWQHKKDGEYASNIAGLGRCDDLHLHQKQSETAFGAGTIAFGVEQIEITNHYNPNQLQNNEYLLWGDNNEIIDFEEIFDKVFHLKRTWKMRSDRFNSPYKLAFRMDHASLLGSLDRQSEYWLLTSEKSLEELSLDRSNVYRLYQEGMTFSADGINHSEINYFTIIKAPEFWARIQTLSPACGSEEAGSILTKPIGGRAPYNIILEDTKGTVVKKIQGSENKIYTFKNIQADQYILKIEDADQKQWTTTVFLNSDRFTAIDLPSKVVLKPGETMFLNPEIDSEETIEYSWQLPDKNWKHGSEIEINSNGIYTLLVEAENCKYWHSIKVIQEENNIASAKIYPNPSTNGFFTLSAELKEAAPYNITISDNSGHVLIQKDYSIDRFINIKDRISSNGVYYITLTSNKSSWTEKLVVVSE